MKLFGLPALAAAQYPAAADSILRALIADPSAKMVCIDRATLSRRDKAATATGEAALLAHRVSLAEWLKQDTERYTPDLQAMHKAAASLSPDRPVILDAAGYSPEVVAEVLHECRAAWFPLVEWHPAFVLVGDEIVLQHMCEALFDTFFVRPMQLTGVEALQLAKGVQRRARLAYWLGFKGKNKQRVERSWSWFDRVLNKNDERDQRKIERWTP